MRHRFSCPLRWADLDLLGHVNNVRYVDYLREARDDLLREAGVEVGLTGLAVRRHELTFVAPLVFGPETVAVDCWLSAADAASATLEAVVHDGRQGGDTFLRSRTVLSARGTDHAGRPFSEAELAALAPYLEPQDTRPAAEPVRVRPLPERDYAVHVRAGDLDLTGHVGDVALVEYFQEARIAFLRQLRRQLPGTGRMRVVVAQTDIDNLRPMTRGATYTCSTRVARVGTKSLCFESVIRGADGTEHATARVVVVPFDPETQRSTEPPAGYREVLEGLVEPD